MRIDILSLFPKIIKCSLEHSIIKKALKKNLVSIKYHNIRDYSKNKHKKVDDYQYGGGSGMVLMIQPIYDCIDQRVREYFVTDEISIGDYVISGGELAAAVFCDSIIRLIPGVLGDESSALTDSFQDNRLSEPIYTRPKNYKGLSVPKILISGNNKEIEKWRDEKSFERTKKHRPDLL